MSKQTFLEFKIPHIEAATSVFNFRQLIVLKLESYGYKIKPSVLFFSAFPNDHSYNEEYLKEIMEENGIESIETTVLEKEQCYLIKVKNKL
jgi:hypothetical protein